MWGETGLMPALDSRLCLGGPRVRCNGSRHLFEAPRTLPGSELSVGTRRGLDCLSVLARCVVAILVSCATFLATTSIAHAQDGGASGAELVKDVNPGPADGEIGNLTRIGAELYFTAEDPEYGKSLWASDGSSAGTRLVYPGFQIGDTLSGHNEFTEVDGTLYFTMYKTGFGVELWKSDGTASGTVMVKDINAGPADSHPHHLRVLNGQLYFAATGEQRGVELWTSDGTPNGTVMVEDLNPTGSSNPGGFYPASQRGAVVEMGDELIFMAFDGQRTALFVLDAEDDSIRRLPNPVMDERSGLTGLTEFGGTVLFALANGESRDLWRTDGTIGGTYKLKSDLAAGRLVEMNGRLYFSGRDVSDGDGHGTELWATDGTSAGTTMVADLTPGFQSTDPTWLVRVDDRLFFTGSGGSRDGGLWVSDGTAAGSVELDVPPGLTLSYFHDAGGVLVFSGHQRETGNELWRSDGTDSGTRMVRDLYPGEQHGLGMMETMGGRLYFAGNDPTHAMELWRTTGGLDDADGDGIGADSDNCPDEANAEQIDTDSDGTGNVCDSDDDNDGVVDSSDAFPNDPSEDTDTDSDGVGDKADNCPAAKGDPANAGCTIPAWPPTDSDGDGVMDIADRCPARAGTLAHDGCLGSRSSCQKARARHRAAKERLLGLRARGASKAKIKRAKRAKRKAAASRAEVCA